MGKPAYSPQKPHKPPRNRTVCSGLWTLIEKIVVHECSYDENGTRRQDIEIYYSFVGKIDLPE